MESWFFPITLLPGIGLFTTASANLSHALSAEITVLIDKGKKEYYPIIDKKVKQLKRLSIALILLFISACCFCVSGLLGGLAYLSFFPGWMEYAVLFMGLIATFCAFGILIVYASMAVGIKEEQFKISRDLTQ